MRKNILLPTDFSKNSWNAIQYAVKLYENQECDFYILNTYNSEAFGLKSVIMLDPDESLNKLSERRSIEGLSNILYRLMNEQQNSSHNFFMVSRAATLLEAVEDLTTNLSIDLVVMGAKGNANEREGKYGRKTLEVIENIRNYPVLVIPMDVAFDHPKEIVLATNFDTDFKVSKVKYLAEIAQIGNARIQIISQAENGSLSPQQKRNKMLLRKYFKDIDHSFKVLHNVKMVDALSCFVEINRSNMISYIDKKPSIWQRLGFGKPFLGKLGYYENVPVLALQG
jgi:nucleotide-binding universal stress UspA family protein